MCACLPAIRMVLVKAFPVLGGSTLRSRGNKYYQQYGSGPSSKSASRSAGLAGGPGGAAQGTVAAATADQTYIEHDPEGRGIRFQKSYQVHYTTEDEARLVPMHDLDGMGRGVRR